MATRIYKGSQGSMLQLKDGSVIFFDRRLPGTMKTRIYKSLETAPILS